MTPATLLAELRRRDVELTAEGDTLRYNAPKGALTAELRQALAEHKGELLALLLDPRPDIEEDAHLWGAVLAEARRTDPAPDTECSLFGLLHGLRCGGARLRWTSVGRLRLDYSALVEPGLWEEAALRQGWLMPAAEGIKRALAAAERQHPPAVAQVGLFGGGAAG